jgi:hypothetical protein
MQRFLTTIEKWTFGSDELQRAKQVDNVTDGKSRSSKVTKLRESNLWKPRKSESLERYQDEIGSKIIQQRF